jgi:hypothetical protein
MFKVFLCRAVVGMHVVFLVSRLLFCEEITVVMFRFLPHGTHLVSASTFMHIVSFEELLHIHTAGF